MSVEGPPSGSPDGGREATRNVTGTTERKGAGDMEATATMGIGLEVSDVSGQKMLSVRELAPDWSVGELVHGLLGRMNLPQQDVSGRPLNYQARLEREGRHLHASERVGDALKSGDHVVLLPNIDAGGARPR
jgi:hypothetical protein